MRRIVVSSIVVSFLWLPSWARASSPIGILAIIDKVVLEPDEKAPERIQIWGAFSIARKGTGGDKFQDPGKGFLYFQLKTGDEDKCRKEWKDLMKLAKSGKIAAFGNRWEQDVHARKPEEKPKDPDVYATSIGLSSMDRDTQYGPARTLVKFASPTEPLDGEEVAPGPVTLVLRESIVGEHKDAKVFFELEGPRGAKETSPGVGPGKAETSWTPKLELLAGAKYKWRVWAADDQWKSASQIFSFSVKPEAKAGK